MLNAIEFIVANRTWTVVQRTQTISTIWAGDQNVRNYYATQTRPHGRWLGRSLGLPSPSPIPAVPFTAADVDHAKATNTMPVPVPVPAPVPAPLLRPGPAAPLPPVAAVPAAAPAYISSQLHDFWPRLPWSPEPDLPPFELGAIKKDLAARDTWLNSETRMRPPGDGPQWHGIKLLGTGGYGAAGLRVEADATNNIIDRMVIKETKATKSQWRDPKNWRDRMPREIRIHQLLEEPRAVDPAMCRHIIRLRAHRLMMQSRRYRLYLDYHAGGDLNGAMERCAANWQNGRKDAIEDEFVPEGFVWYTIKALATACLVLQNGTTLDVLVDGWRPITHLDMRLPNVLLDVYTPPDQDQDEGSTASESSNIAGVDKDRAKENPVIPILADFGISFFSPNSDGCPISDNPDQYLASVDTRYPPEMHQQVEPCDIKLGEKTDVWGLGNIAWTLIANRKDDAGPFRCQSYTSDAEFQSWEGRVPLAIGCKRNYSRLGDTDVFMSESVTNPAADEYGPQIKELVRRCLNYNQDDRPTLREIIAEAEQFLEDPDNATFVDQIRDYDGLLLVLPKASHFAVGKPVDKVKRRRRR